MKKVHFRLGRCALALAAASALTVGLGFLTTGSASASTTAYTPIRNAGPNQLCLDVMSEDGLQNDGARLQLYHCTGVSEQKFILVQADTGEGPVPGYFEIRPRSSPGKCLVPDDNHSAFTGQPVPGGQGAQVVQQTCAFFAQDQNWTFESTNEIVNQFWGTCLDTTGGGTRDHEHVMIWPCNGNLTQRWIS
jgi:hypothetical protein